MKGMWCSIARADCLEAGCVFWSTAGDVCLVKALIVNILAQMPLGDDVEKEDEDAPLKTDQGEVLL